MKHLKRFEVNFWDSDDMGIHEFETEAEDVQKKKDNLDRMDIHELETEAEDVQKKKDNLVDPIIDDLLKIESEISNVNSKQQYLDLTKRFHNIVKNNPNLSFVKYPTKLEHYYKLRDSVSNKLFTLRERFDSDIINAAIADYTDALKIENMDELQKVLQELKIKHNIDSLRRYKSVKAAHVKAVNKWYNLRFNKKMD